MTPEIRHHTRARELWTQTAEPRFREMLARVEAWPPSPLRWFLGAVLRWGHRRKAREIEDLTRPPEDR